MTDQDNLRNRIARAIFNVRDDEFDLDEWDDLDSTDRERYVCDAQAIIDEFGLTVETAVDMSIRTTDKRTGNVRYGEKARVVGKWEKR